MFEGRLEKYYSNEVKERMNKEKEKKIEELKHENMLLKHDLENSNFNLNHLKESIFIRSFIMLDGNGSWVRPIYEADVIAYGNNNPPSDGGVFELQKELKEINHGEVLHIINNPKVVIIKFDRVQTIGYKESLIALFKKQGIECIIIDKCEIDYIC